MAPVASSDDEAACFFLFGTQQSPSKSGASGSVTCEFLVEFAKCNRSPDAWLGFSCTALLNHSRLVSRCLDTWEIQSVTRCLSWILSWLLTSDCVFFELRSMVGSFLSHCSHRENASACQHRLCRRLVHVEASSVNGWRLFAS